MILHSFCQAALAAGLFAGALSTEASEHAVASPEGEPRTSESIASAAQLPDELSTADWSSIRAAYDAERHRVVAVDGGHQAWNPGQRWTAHFDGRGFEVRPDSGGAWTWGLELAAYGWGEDVAAVNEPLATETDGGRLAYVWEERLTEWCVNDTRGVEHGFTVATRPQSAEGALRLAITVRGGLEAVVSKDGRDVRFADASGATLVSYVGLTVLDADGANVPARFVASPQGLQLVVRDAEASYPLTIDPIAQQAYLKASNTGTVDFFGDSVASSGDTVVVGASGEDSSATGINGNQSDNSINGAGAAYVFVRSGTGWSQQAYLKASNTDAVDRFGWSVSVSGDTVVVGAIAESSNSTGVNGNQGDNSAPGSGAAYVFVRNGTTWSQQAYLKASNTDAGDRFGESVSVSGDTVVVGAWAESSNATGVNGDQNDNSAQWAGAAYVFVRSGTSWSQQAYLKASNTDAGDEFGLSVSVSGDTVVVGARNESSDSTGVNGSQSNNSAQWSGAAYVFVRIGTDWSQQDYLKASNTDAGDFFGGSVSVSGDTVVVGAHDEDSNSTGVNGNQSDNSATFAGAAYVFVRSGTSWSQQAYLKASNTDAGDRFGWSVSVSGNTVVVGAAGETSNAAGINGNQSDNSAQSAGAAYLFEIPNGPVPYCTPKPSSAGCLAAIGTTSPTQPVSGAGDYQVTATNVHSVKVGLLFASLNGAAALPWLGGTLCVAPPLAKRGPLVASGGVGQDNCTGTFATLVNDGLLPPNGLDAGSGNSGWYQYWYRDPNNGAGNFGTALSNAIQLDFN